MPQVYYEKAGQFSQKLRLLIESIKNNKLKNIYIYIYLFIYLTAPGLSCGMWAP